MLQKLENAYLAILRFVVIITATGLLVAVGLFAINSTKMLKAAPERKDASPVVSADELIGKVAAKKAANTEARDESEVSQAVGADPNQAHYNHAAAAIVKFVASHSGGEASPDPERAAAYIKGKADVVGDAKLVASYAKGLADSLDKAFANPAVNQAAPSGQAAFEVVNKLLDAYSEAFQKAVADHKREQDLLQENYAEEKASGLQSMYWAMGAFGAFLSIVFLSILIKIERNLRSLGQTADLAS